MKKADLNKFRFERVDYGVYRVTYTTLRGDYYVARIEDMEYIDTTLHAEEDELKIKDLCALRNKVMRGAHFSKTGERIDTL